MALAAGVGIGLVVSGLIISLTGGGVGGAPLSRPTAIPAEAVWQDNVYGAPRWIQCAAADGKVTCKTYSPAGAKIVVASYVSRDGKAAPTSPFSQIVARQVDSIWVNKIAMVADGSVSFPVAGRTIEFASGVPRGEPGL